MTLISFVTYEYACPGMKCPCNIHQCQRTQMTRDLASLLETVAHPNLTAYQLVQFLHIGIKDHSVGSLLLLPQVHIPHMDALSAVLPLHSLVNEVQTPRVGSHHHLVIYAIQVI